MVLPNIALPRLSFGLSLGILLAIAIALTLALTPTGAAADHGAPHPVVDGFVQDPVTGVVEEAYVVQGITYTQDQLTGDFAGLLYTAEDATNFYFGFAQSVFINDNTYSDGNKNDPNNPEIGWDSIGRSHRIQDLLQSEHIEVQIFSTPDPTFPRSNTFPGYSSLRDAANYNLAFQGRQMRPDSLKFLLSWTNHRPAKPKIPKPLVYDQVSSLGSPFALYDPVTVINPDAPKVD